MNNVEIRNYIGNEYLNRDWIIEEETPFVEAAFAEISKVNRELFSMIPFEVIFTNKDIYESAADMRKQVTESGKIYIYDGWEGHPYLSLEDNLIGRAVHDVWAHLVCGCPFTFTGEYTAYLEQRKYYPSWTWDVLFSEIPAQTAAFYVNGKSHIFKQRAIVAPRTWVQFAEMLELEDFSSNSVMKSLLHA